MPLPRLHRYRAPMIAAAVLSVLLHDVAALSTPSRSQGKTASAGDWSFLPTTTVEKLSRQIDLLEKHLDTYGTAVAKSPDVWGEARLTKYRTEYERIMEERANKFTNTLNASISRSDQAFLASTLALQAAISGQAATMSQPTVRTVNRTSQTVALDSKGQILVGTDGKPILLTNTIPESTPGIEEAPITTPSAPSAALVGTPSFVSMDTFAEKDIRGFGSNGVAIEPTLSLDQMSRYLHHLQELRRINDGDDKADSPGYALHLVRLPVSILPGQKTREGYGAEVTFIARPHLHERLLHATFRALVINDIVDQYSFPLASFLDGADAEAQLKAVNEWDAVDAPQDVLDRINQNIRDIKCILRNIGSLPDDQESLKNEKEALLSLSTAIGHDAKAVGLISEESLEDLLCAFETLARIRTSPILKGGSNGNEMLVTLQKKATIPLSLVTSIDDKLQRATSEIESIAGILNSASVVTNSGLPTFAGARDRRSIFPFPATQIADVHGVRILVDVATLAWPLKQERFNKKHTLVADLQTFLGEEFNAAYEYLNSIPELWSHCTPDLVNAVRTKNKKLLAALRMNFLRNQDLDDGMRFTKGLAWAIIVESALLNERLVQDMHELASSRNAPQLNVGWLPFFGPHPSPEAICAFNEYVNVRWPIHVVAVDPVAQDQNVADRFSQRREMQLALSLAFASGRIGAQSFTQFSRRIELDMETIGLNRTVVGFSHGSDTFGWRFMPRVQSPDTESPAKAVGRMLFTGGPTRDYLLREARLEPGLRECTAIVIMPSFVPYVIFDMRTNWFKLTNPARKELDLRDGVGLSAQITCLRTLTEACVQDQHLYRPDEVHRLTRAVDQLERRLPLQTTYVQMPYENSLGGFEFFNSGVSDLAPELRGYYGEPGIRIGEKQETTVFLVGDHFSLHETKVIVGNKRIELDSPTVRGFSLLSRQVMQVTIPGDVHDEDGGVDVHVATPYGVSNHIIIPVAEDPAKKAAKATSDAIEKHVSEKHIDRFVWSKPEISIRVNLNESREPQAVFVEESISVLEKSDAPLVVDKACFEFAAYLIPQAKGKAPDPTGRITVEMFNVGSEVLNQERVIRLDKSSSGAACFSATLGDRLLAALQKYNAPLPRNLESFTIFGYLRPEGSVGAQSVSRVEGPLVLKVRFCEAPCLTGKNCDLKQGLFQDQNGVAPQRVDATPFMPENSGGIPPAPSFPDNYTP